MPTVTEQPDITLVSTTESQAELDHATGPNWREKFDPDQAKAAAGEGDDKKNKSGESTETKDDSKTAAASDAAKGAGKEGTKSEDEDLPKGAKKQIDRLTAKRREAEERADAAERELARLRGQGKPETKAAEKADAEPNLEDYIKKAKTYEEGLQKWNKDHTAWVVRQENATRAAKDAEEAANQSAKETYDAHLERLEAARTAHDDFDDAVKEMPAFTFSSPAANQAFQMAIVEADNGPELMYHLATHPDEMAKFADLSPVKVQMMIGRLSDKLNPSTSTNTARATPKSQAPAPTTPLRGSTTAATALDDPKLVKNTDDWIAKRKAQLSQRNRPH
jgi:hypothetical protein